MLNRYYYFYSADCVVNHFEDNGLFGLKTMGPCTETDKMIKTMS